MTTIGVSVAVPEPWGAQLQAYRVELGDSSAAGIPTHITLLPPIDVEDVLLPGIIEHLEQAAREVGSFTVHLRGTGTFRPVSPVVFLTLVEGISGCELLAKAVRQGPLAIDAAFPYHPHVTVAHHLSDDRLDAAFAELGEFDCRFEVTEFSLYRHEDPLGWVPDRSFPLAR